MAFKTEAIVLRGRPYSGPDKIYDVLTPREGKLSVIARSAARTSSKLSGHLQPFAHVRLMIGRGRQDHVAGAATIESFSKLRENTSNFFLASSLVELVLRCNVPGSAAADEFSLLAHAMRIVADAREQREKVMAVRIFLWKLLSLSGWRPNTEQCARCRKTLADGAQWYEDVHGFVCADHGAQGIALSKDFLPFLETVLTSDDWRELMQQADAHAMSKQWLEVSQRFYQDVISEPIISLKLLAYV